MVILMLYSSKGYILTEILTISLETHQKQCLYLCSWNTALISFLSLQKCIKYFLLNIYVSTNMSLMLGIWFCECYEWKL